VSTEHAALVEPRAVGLRAVAAADLGPDDLALVVTFAFAYRPEEFARALDFVAEQKVDLEPFLTGVVAVADIGTPSSNCAIRTST